MPRDRRQVFGGEGVVARGDGGVGEVEAIRQFRQRLIEHGLQAILPFGHLAGELWDVLEVDDDRPLGVVAEELLVGRDDEERVGGRVVAGPVADVEIGAATVVGDGDLQAEVVAEEREEED